VYVLARAQVENENSGVHNCQPAQSECLKLPPRPRAEFPYRGSEGNNMAGNKLTIKLTEDQQKQIKDATGKNASELSIDLAAVAHLSEKDLDQVAGGIDKASPILS